MRYPGGKNAAGTWQKIINQIPPHGRYVEAFAGSAAVLRRKRPAAESYAIDLCPGAIANLGGEVPERTKLVEGDAIWWIRSRMTRAWWRPSDFLYCDPPYVLSTRTSGPMYEHELSDEDHASLLDVLRRLPCMVMVSGYWSDLYADGLAGWRTISFDAITRGGSRRREWLWMNYPEPMALHDYRYLGDDSREREKLAKRRRRWVARLARMDRLERQMLLWAMQEAGNGFLEPTPDPASAPGQPGPTAISGVVGR